MKLKRLPKTFIIGILSGLLLGWQITKAIEVATKKKESEQFKASLEEIKMKNDDLFSEIENLNIKYSKKK